MSNTSSIIRCRNAAKMKITHAFHFVELSPGPLLASSGCGTLTVGCVMYFHNYELGLLVLALGLVLIGSVLSIGGRDVIREGLFQGSHTCSIQAMMIEGFVLFILSEVMFFVAGFGAFFHCSLAPPVELGCVGPSNCIDLISTGGVPGFNTVLLLSSGATVTLCHHCLMCSRYKHSLVSLQATIWLAGIFTFGQGYEYQTTGLNISDGNAGFGWECRVYTPITYFAYFLLHIPLLGLLEATLSLAGSSWYDSVMLIGTDSFIVGMLGLLLPGIEAVSLSQGLAIVTLMILEAESLPSICQVYMHSNAPFNHSSKNPSAKIRMNK